MENPKSPKELISSHPVLKDIKLEFIIKSIESVMKEYAYQEKCIALGNKTFPMIKDDKGNIIDLNINTKDNAYNLPNEGSNS